MRLIDADELMESIRKALCIKSMTNSLLLPAERTIIDQIDRASTIGSWISVKDKLPENNAVCLTYSPKGKMRVAEAFLPSSIPNSKYDPMECWWSTHGSGGMRFVAVTHWMPLSELPKENEDD